VIPVVEDETRDVPKPDAAGGQPSKQLFVVHRREALVEAAAALERRAFEDDASGRYEPAAQNRAERVLERARRPDRPRFPGSVRPLPARLEVSVDGFGA
jgi:hypothetical protein